MPVKPKEIKPVDIRRAAMNFLARREHAFQELVDKLSTKFLRYADYGYTFEKDSLLELIVEQIFALKNENLQSDERYVESFINGRKSAGKGPVRIRRELEQKQVSSFLINTYLEAVNDQWGSLATEAYLKKFGDSESKDFKEKAKRTRFLVYRGFPHDLVRSIVR
ncbi:MAG: regulatory protein RecX [Oceanicoccus sp.]|uniref:regulatory protein RecX n=1 Tax=Oceanicoccus sp. TaxID=2691044 RepID=UPI00261EBE2B|nr:regulatory protein RecX [Oceanicoccus sp.]MCP3908778.1 regulatory protein RecX [Oceanicoccus sp.]